MRDPEDRWRLVRVATDLLGQFGTLTEAALIGRIDTTLEVLAQVTGRLDEMRDWLVSARTVEEAS